VAWASLGWKLGVETPVVEMIIGLASLVKGVDFWQEGRTVERAGLASLSRGEILRLVNG
jgi:opine dehydrogenase